jgi:hypothetical protein
MEQRPSKSKSIKDKMQRGHSRKPLLNLFCTAMPSYQWFAGLQKKV